MFNKILEQIKKYDTIIIHRHVRPDGDCIGTQQGLKKYLKHNFPNKHIYAVGDTRAKECKQAVTACADGTTAAMNIIKNRIFNLKTTI